MALIEEYITNYIILTMHRQANGNEHGHYWMLQEINQAIFFLWMTTARAIVVDTSYTFLLASFSPPFFLGFLPLFLLIFIRMSYCYYLHYFSFFLCFFEAYLFFLRLVDVPITEAQQ